MGTVDVLDKAPQGSCGPQITSWVWIPQQHHWPLFATQHKSVRSSWWWPCRPVLEPGVMVVLVSRGKGCYRAEAAGLEGG